MEESFPGLFQIGSTREANIAQYQKNNSWSPIFRRNLQDWEFNDCLAFLEALSGYNIDDLQPDKILLGNSKGGMYTVKEG